MTGDLVFGQGGSGDVGEPVAGCGRGQIEALAVIPDRELPFVLCRVVVGVNDDIGDGPGVAAHIVQHCCGRRGQGPRRGEFEADAVCQVEDELKRKVGGPGCGLRTAVSSGTSPWPDAVDGCPRGGAAVEEGPVR